ncbi:ATP-binding protein, partial [Klebsiella pneumoniae]
LSHTPPFVSVHHNVTLKSLVGGLAGNTIVPGAMTQAHHGVLFIDEAPECERAVMQALRTPLESGHVTVARVRGHVNYP